MSFQPIASAGISSCGAQHDIIARLTTHHHSLQTCCLLFISINNHILLHLLISQMAQVCPVVGTTTTVLPPDHPAYDTSDPEARCPVTNAKVSHHGQNVIHSHPSSPTIPDDKNKAMDASLCPVASRGSRSDSLDSATCPVVGSVSAVLPPSHPRLTQTEAGQVCPVTNATLGHHQGKVHEHPSVPDGR